MPDSFWEQIRKAIGRAAPAAPSRGDIELPPEPKGPTSDASTWDLRADGSKKGLGFLGPILRPDGRVSSEISIGVDFDGKEMEIPTMVPTLTAAELRTLLTMPEDAPIPQAIVNKAVAHAQQRRRAGLSPFASEASEIRADLFPSFKRATVIPATR